MDPVDWGGGAAEVDMAGLLKPLSPLEAAVPTSLPPHQQDCLLNLLMLVVV